MVVLRLHFDQVETDELDAAKPANQPQRITAARSPDFRRPGARGKAWVDEIDVEREEDRAASDALVNLRQHRVDAALQQLLGGNELQPQRPRAAAGLGTVERAADPQLHRPPRIDQAFLDRALAPGAMGVTLAPVVVPGVGV